MHRPMPDTSKIPQRLASFRGRFMRLRRLAAAGLALACLAGLPACSSLDASNAQEEQAILDRVAAGNASLDCTITCTHSYIFNQRKLFAMYAANDWRHLAVAVVNSGYRMDVTYFLLGSAAQGLGNFQAAILYYRYAGALATGNLQSQQCRGIQACNGVRLPQDLPPRIRACETALAAQASQEAMRRRAEEAAAARQRAEAPPVPVVARPLVLPVPVPAAASAPPAAGASDWIDPPPTRR
jgi:hypothetical protein